MADELSQDEVFDNDLDPIEALAAIRREEGNEEAAGKIEHQKESDVVEDKPETQETAEEVDSGATTQEKEDVPADIDTSGEEGEEESGEGSDETAAEDTPAEVIKRKFKASGQEFEFTEAEMMEQFEGIFGKAMDYTQKMQGIAPYRKMISALEEESITQEQFNLALDVLKGDKAAIKKLAEDREIDLSALSFDEEIAPYEANDYGKTESEIQIREIEKSISGDPEYKQTVDVIDVQWDDLSRKAVAENPSIITGLHHDIKSGIYAKVAPEAMKLQLSDGNSKSQLEYYILAGQAYQESLKKAEGQQKVDELNSNTQQAAQRASKESSEAISKRAASPTSSIAGKKGVVDYLDDNDEKFDAWYKKVTNAN